MPKIPASSTLCIENKNLAIIQCCDMHKVQVRVDIIFWSFELMTNLVLLTRFRIKIEDTA